MRKLIDRLFAAMGYVPRGSLFDDQEALRAFVRCEVQREIRRSLSGRSLLTRISHAERLYG